MVTFNRERTFASTASICCVLPADPSQQHRRSIRSDTKGTLIAAIAQGRRWLKEVIEDPAATTESNFVLPCPFDGQTTEARDPQAVRQMAVDCGFDEFGRKE